MISSNRCESARNDHAVAQPDNDMPGVAREDAEAEEEADEVGLEGAAAVEHSADADAEGAADAI
jgi:hypothetical protein